MSAGPSASDLAARLAQRRADWLSRYFPVGRLRAGVFELGSADGDAGRSFPIPLRGQPRLVDFAGGFAGDDLALLARAIGAGNDMAAAYREAVTFLGLSRSTSTRPTTRSSARTTKCQDDGRGELAKVIWRQAETIGAGLPFDYLARRRGLNDWDCDRVRWHPACPWGKERVGCIVVPVVCHRTGYTVAIWRVKPVMEGEVERRGLGPTKHNFAPVCVATGDELAIAEGVEDALAFHELSGVPCWAALSAGNMADLILPARFRRAIIVQDNDAPDRNGRRPGPEAAQKLARRLRAEGRAVRIIASDFGKDANDALLMAVQ